MNALIDRVQPGATNQDRVDFVRQRLHPEYVQYFRGTPFTSLQALAEAAAEAQKELLYNRSYIPTWRGAPTLAAPRSDASRQAQPSDARAGRQNTRQFMN